MTINAGLRQSFYVSMSTSNAYLKYGANYTTDSAFNSVVVEDTNLFVYPGAATKSLFGEYLTPRFFSGAIEYNILKSSKDKVSTTTNTPTKFPTRRPRLKPSRFFDQ